MLPRVGRTGTFGKHDDAGFADNGNAYQHHDQDDEGEAEHYVFLVGHHGLSLSLLNKDGW